MSSKLIVCPSGLEGEVRGLKVKEANILADNSAARRNTTFDQILKSVWLQTTSPGPYAEPVNLQKVLQCDRFYIMLQSRIITFGAEYTFPVQCSHPGCRHKFEWTEDLNRLRMKSLPDKSKEVFLASNRFQTTLDGKQVEFKLITGEDEAKMAKFSGKARDKLVSVSLASRIVQVEGVDSNDRMKWIENLDMGEVRELLEQLDEVDGGVETTIEVECPACLNMMELELPFERDFYMPRLRRMVKKDQMEEPVTS